MDYDYLFETQFEYNKEKYKIAESYNKLNYGMFDYIIPNPAYKKEIKPFITIYKSKPFKGILGNIYLEIIGSNPEHKNKIVLGE